VISAAARLGFVAAAIAALFPAAAGASQLIDRNASRVRLAVSRDGVALLSYTAGGLRREVVARGAVDALIPTRSRPQVEFAIDYSGSPKPIANACRRYDGPRLPLLVTACRASDGSYWAVQRWQRKLPNLGFTPWLPEQLAWELRLSHWTGPLARLEVWTDWSYAGRFHSMFGRMTYRGRPVYGFRRTATGVPLDDYGRNLYLDTFDSAYGSGWRRENSFLAQRPTGTFCYGFFPRAPYPGYPKVATGQRPAGNGRRYRITVIGPGVTPDVTWEGPGLPAYDPANPAHVEHEQEMNLQLAKLESGKRLCRR
jgi:hypothetical protein